MFRLSVFLVIAFSVLYNITRFFEYRHETYEVPTEVRTPPVVANCNAENWGQKITSTTIFMIVKSLVKDNTDRRLTLQQYTTSLPYLWMWGGRMTSYVAVPTKQPDNVHRKTFNTLLPNVLFVRPC